jgi:YidC/Oxa1 family membrane protein insertase
MFNGLFEIVSGTLNFFFTLVPNYAIAIALLTCVLMIITTPLTLKGTRSMIEMQRLQPEIRRLQVQYKDDRQKLNEELMAFYKEHQINPVGGCLPLLIQAPVFSILFWVVRGLTNQAKFIGVQDMVQTDFPGLGTSVFPPDSFAPKYLNTDAELYKSLVGQDHMNSFGVDLAQTPVEALSVGFLHALPYILMVGIIALLSWYQQKQIMGRNAGAEISQQQQMMMRIGPLMFVFFTAVSPAAIGVYFVTSTLWRVGQQHYITRSLYSGEDSVGRQAQQAMAELRESRKDGAKGGGTKGGGAKGGGKGGAGGGRPRPSGNGSSPGGAKAGKQSGRTPQDKTPAGAGGGKAKPHPRSKKKKKRK